MLLRPSKRKLLYLKVLGTIGCSTKQNLMCRRPNRFIFSLDEHKEH
jgi:hypothetical protein